MRRTTLMLDPDLLERATRALGAKTYSAAVNAALEEALRQAKVRDLWGLVGSGIWEGDLAAMRRDRPAQRKPKRR